MTIGFCIQKNCSVFTVKMNLFDFGDSFPNEESYLGYFLSLRLKLVVKCKKCSSSNHYWKKDKKCFQCKQCGYRTALRSGTAIKNSHLPYLYWFKAIHLMTATTKSFSANEIQKQLKHNHYEPIWKMLHSIRIAMGNRDSRYKLTEYIEIDEGFFETIDKSVPKDEPLKRGSQKQAKVLVLIESKPVEDKKPADKHRPDSQVGNIKMIVMEQLDAESINLEIEKGVQKDTLAITDAYKVYNHLELILKEHKVVNTSGIKEVHTVLPWVHSAIGNAKKILQVIHHSNQNDYLENYLNEFCYKYNRRYFGEKIFDRLLIACIEN
jgi:hypothetical protein